MIALSELLLSINSLGTAGINATGLHVIKGGWVGLNC